MMKRLIVSRINHDNTESSETKAALSEILNILSIILDENITSISEVLAAEINLKRSLRFYLDDSAEQSSDMRPADQPVKEANEGNFFDISFEKIKSPLFFRGVFRLAQFINANTDSGVTCLGPVKKAEINPRFTKKLSIKTPSGNYLIAVSGGTESFEALGRRLNFRGFIPADPAPVIVRFDLFGLRDEGSGQVKTVEARGSSGMTLRGQIGALGSFIVEELIMDKHQDEITAEIKLGSISLKILDLLEIKPGSEIDIDWPAESRGVLSIGGNKWAEVKIKLEHEKLSLIFPKDATFGA